MFSLNFMFFCSLIEYAQKKKAIKQVVTLILDMSVIKEWKNWMTAYLYICREILDDYCQ